MKRFMLLLLIVLWTSQAQAAVVEPTGLWEFNAPDTNEATLGAALELVGSAQEVPGFNAADGAIQIGQGSYYVCTHGVAPNGGGAMVNEYTLLMDFSYPASSMSDPPNGYNDLFQTDPTNASDSDWTINSSGAIGIGAVGYTGAHGYTTGPDTWYRMVIVVDNGTLHDIYVDGVEIFKGNQQGVDGRFALAETILLFCAGNNQDGDDAPINVSTVAFWDAPLGAEDIQTMGLAGDRFFIQKFASNPTPNNGADDVLITTDLAWTPGEYAATHNVYFSQSQADVDAAAAGALIAEGLARDPSRLEIERLDYGQTYYWRVDEVNATPANAVYEGDTWSFTTEPSIYPIEGIVVTSNTTSLQGQGPENIVDGSGLSPDGRHSTTDADMWLGDPIPGETPYLLFEFDNLYKLHEIRVWNFNLNFEMWLGFGVKDATLEYSEDGADWVSLGDVVLSQGPGAAGYEYNTTIPMDGISARFVRMWIGSSYLSTESHGLSEVQFMYVPVQARKPQPADGATGVAIDATLSWRAGREAASHEVYLGTDPEALALVETMNVNSYAATLDLGATYYWQVVEVNDAEAISSWAGDIWSFSTQESIEIDGFESYDDDFDAGTAIWQSWVDGLEDGANGGSMVGNDPSPFAELTIVHSGRQSMPMYYDNDNSSAFSEADHVLSPAQDWTANGIKVLSLWFHGAEGNTGQLYAKVNETKVLYTGPAADIALAEWLPFNVDLSTAGNVNNVTSVSVGIQGTGVGVLYVDDVRLYAEAPN